MSHIFLSLVKIKSNNMKNYIYLVFSFLVLNSFSQNTFWNESFGQGCNKGQYASGVNPSGLGTWTVVSVGINDQYANKWFISAAEAGMGAGNCGSGCGTNTSLTNRTLHIGYDVPPLMLLDDGAVYGSGNGISDSDIRAQSPTINCTGQNTITLSFVYLLKGIPGADFFEVQYSANGGTSWSLVATPPPTPTSAACNPQGIWTSYSVALPASCNNNANVKIGFRWQNIDGTGSDPGGAIDDVKLTSQSAQAFAPSFTVTSPVCTGVSQTLTANTGTFAISGYTWSAAPSGATFGSPNSSATAVSFAPSNVYTITLTATSGTTTASSTQTIVVNASPAIAAFAMPSPGCPGQQFTLTATGAMTYTWNPGNLTGASVVVTPTNPTAYTVIGIANNGCTATASTVVSMNNAPAVTASTSSSLICAGNSTTLSASGATTYTWNPGNLTGSIVVVSPTISTTYSVTGSLNGTPCTTTKTVAVNVSPCTGISKAAAENATYHLYPNPASDKLNITSAVAADVTIEISDAVGKIVIKQTQNLETTEAKGINIGHLAPGIYFVKIASGYNTEVIRFVKE
jgi:hypothetical protein